MNDQCEHFDGCTCQDSVSFPCLRCGQPTVQGADGWHPSHCDDCNRATEHAVMMREGGCQDTCCKPARDAYRAALVSLVKPFPKGARVVYRPTFGGERLGTVLGQEREGTWAVLLDNRKRPVRGGTLQLTRI